ncbi:MAG: CHAT domain-containing protein [Acidobacteriota bacterium]
MKFNAILILLVILIVFSGHLNSGDTSKDFDQIEKNKLKNKIYNLALGTKEKKYREVLGKIFEIYKRKGGRQQTLNFYISLVRSRKHRFIAPYSYYYLSRFYSGKKRKFYLMKGLDNSFRVSTKIFSLKNLHWHFKVKGDRKNELKYVIKLINLQKESSDIVGLEDSLFSIANFFKTDSDYLKALQYFFEAKKYSFRLRRSGNGYIFYEIGRVFFVLGKTGLAKKYLKKSLDHAIKFNNNDLKVRALNSYSRIFYEKRDYRKALKYSELSTQLEEKLGTYLDTMMSNYRKALIYFRTGKEDEGMALLKKAVKSGLENNRFTELLSVISDYTERLINTGRQEEAKAYLSKIDDIYAPYYKGYFFYYYLKAVSFERRGSLKNAVYFYNKTLQNLDKYFILLKNQKYYLYKTNISIIYSRIARFYFKMFDLTNNVKYLNKAIFIGEVKNSFIYKLKSGKSSKYENIIKEREKIKKEVKVLVSKLSGFSGGIISDKGRFYRKKIKRLNVQVMELNEFLLETPVEYIKYRINELKLGKIRKNLRPGSVIIKFMVLEDYCYIFLIDKKSIGYKRIETESKIILDMARRLTAPFDDFSNGEVDFLRVRFDIELANRLYKILLEDVLEFQRDKRTLYIIPDKELFKLPFEAFVTKILRRKSDPGVVFSEYANARFLIEDFSVSYFFSLFHFQKKYKLPRKPIYITAFGNPEMDKIVMENLSISGNSIGSLGRIPSSESEILDIKKIYGSKKGRYYLGDSFTKKNFKNNAKRSRIIHLATHFINNKNFPRYSSFVFSRGDKEDPLFYVSDLSKLKLNSELVFLSACESSEKNLMGEQGLKGMTASFSSAGVKSMISSLWPVDEFSSKIISPFYKELKNELSGNPDIPEVLRRVKINFFKLREKVKKGLVISYRHPIIWATFILYNFYY